MADWKEEIPLSEVLRNEDLTLERIRELVVERVKASGWYQGSEEYGELWDVVDEMASADTEKLFGYLLGQLYDLADDDLIWLGL